MWQLTLMGFLLLVTPIAAVVAFVTMNPVGALNMFMTSGAFILGTILHGMHAILAGLYWVFSSGIAFIVNIMIGGMNAVINSVNAWLILDIPKWTYISPPIIAPTLEQIMGIVGNSWQNVMQASAVYTTGVQQNAPVSYMVGTASAGTTVAGAWAVNPPQQQTTGKKKVFFLTEEETTERKRAL